MTLFNAEVFMDWNYAYQIRVFLVLAVFTVASRPVALWVHFGKRN